MRVRTVGPEQRHLLPADPAGTRGSRTRRASYDKRGVGASSGDWLAGTIDDFAVDAAAALDFLRSQPGVQAETTGLFGHSEGVGWFCALRPTRMCRVTRWPPPSGRSPVTPDDAEITLAAHDRLVKAGRRGADFAAATRLVRSFRIPASVEELFGEYWSEMDESLWEFTKRK